MEKEPEIGKCGRKATIPIEPEARKEYFRLRTCAYYYRITKSQITETQGQRFDARNSPFIISDKGILYRTHADIVFKLGDKLGEHGRLKVPRVMIGIDYGQT